MVDKIKKAQTDVNFFINPAEIASSYKFTEDNKYGLRLVALKGSTKKVSTKLYISTISELYREFLKILSPFSDHGVYPMSWIETINRNSDFYNEVVEQEVMNKIVEHANTYGMGYKTPNKIIQSAMKHAGHPADLIMMPTLSEEGNHESHVASLKNIVLMAIVMYDSINATEDQELDELVVDFINTFKTSLHLNQIGTNLNVDGYWECIWWSFALDENRLKATKCGNCGKLLIRTTRAKFCNTKCRSAYHYKLKGKKPKTPNEMIAIHKKMIGELEKLNKQKNDMQITESIVNLKKALLILEQEKK